MCSVHRHENFAESDAYSHTHDVLTAFMTKHGFEVTPHYFLDTAWLAKFKRGNGGRTLGINSEMDALPGIGHACGHNLIAISGVAVAIAVKKVMEEFDIAGTISLLGTPGESPPWLCFSRVLTEGLFAAEESGYGKVRLIRKGAYEGMDVCLMYVSVSLLGFILTTSLGVTLLQDPRYPLVCRAVSLLTRCR